MSSDGFAAKPWADVALADIDAGDTGFQFRLASRLGDLRASLERDGQLEPVDLLAGKPHKVVDGFRRIAAARELGMETVRAYLHEGLDERDALRLSFTKNVVRRNLAPLEKANAMHLAQRKGVKKGELVEVFGISERQVERYLELLDFPKQILAVLDGEVVTMAHAKALADFGVKDAKKWRQRIEEGQLDARSLRRAFAQERGKGSRGKAKQYLKKSGDKLRVYPFAISREAPRAEREKVIKLLQEAIAFLKG